MAPITDLSKPTTAEISVFNSGKTFALKVTYLATITVSPTAPKELDYYTALTTASGDAIKSVGLIAPNRGYPNKLELPKGIFGINKAATSDWYIYVWGDVTYHDVFKNTPERRTTFCGIRKISASREAFDQCGVNNDANQSHPHDQKIT